MTTTRMFRTISILCVALAIAAPSLLAGNVALITKTIQEVSRHAARRSQLLCRAKKYARR